MHSENLSAWTHSHVFTGQDTSAENSTRVVAAITAAMMVVEILAGWLLNSMALLADGWHMSSHTLAIGLSALAYAQARRRAADGRFAFGTWKIEVLAGYTSAVLLMVIAAIMVWGSIGNLLAPKTIRFTQAIPIALVGLTVNIVCALILGKAHHGHSHDHDHGQGDESHHDLNLKSAYIHVAVDAATSVLAVLALTGGLYLGWVWLDPVMGIVGAGVVSLWAWGLIRETGKVLLDREMDRPVVAEIREVIEQHPEWSQSTRISDLHVWRVGKENYSCVLSLVTDDKSMTPQAVKAALARHEEISHITVEINLCPH
jgi:cation diffusion facilitator family transporter